LGGLIGLESLSPEKRNASACVSLTSLEMANLPNTTQVGLVHCLDTGNGYTKDVIYKPIYDTSYLRTGFMPVVQAHDHSADDDVNGGSLVNIYYANGDKAVLIDYYKLNTSEFRFFGSYSGGSVGFDDSEGNTTYVMMFTGNTTGNNITLQGDGIRLSFAAKMRYDMRFKLSHNNGISVRAGINIDRLDQTVNTTRVQIGQEGCAGHGTSWVIITSNGNSGNRTATQTLLSLTSAVDLYTMKFLPSIEARLYFGGVSQAASPSGATPSSGNSDTDKQWRMGVWTTDPTGKKMWFQGGHQIAKPHSGF